MSSNGERGGARSIEVLRRSGMSLSCSLLLKLERSCLRYLEISSSSLHSLSYPGYQRFFSRVRRGVSSGRRPKTRAGHFLETAHEKPLAPGVSLSEKKESLFLARVGFVSLPRKIRETKL